MGIRETFKRKGKLFIVFEYMEKNVLELLELYPGGLPTEVVRRSVFQLLKSLRHCHMNGIMHRDIKPVRHTSATSLLCVSYFYFTLCMYIHM